MIGQSISDAVVPAIWHVEVGNALLVQTRRKRLLPASAAEAFERFPTLATEVDTETTGLGWRNGLRLAERHRLTLYDAVYLELAQRRDLPLATLDRELQAAARAEGVPLVPPLE